jgi:carboxymethylenebutenolidase
MSNTDSGKALSDVWDHHMASEFGMKSPDMAIETMTEDTHVNLVPLLNGGIGREGVREFYAKYLCAQIPPDIEIVPISRTVGQDRLVDESVMRFTHSIQVDWLLPGIAPTGKRVEISIVAVTQFKEGKILHEHVYWDQATVLLQVGLIDRSLPVRGAESAAQVQRPSLPMNELMQRKR